MAQSMLPSWALTKAPMTPTQGKRITRLWLFLAAPAVQPFPPSTSWILTNQGVARAIEAHWLTSLRSQSLSRAPRQVALLVWTYPVAKCSTANPACYVTTGQCTLGRRSFHVLIVARLSPNYMTCILISAQSTSTRSHSSALPAD